MANIVPAMVDAEKRRQSVLSLRTMGMNYREILDAMIAQYTRDRLPDSYDVRYVWRDCQDAFRRLRESSIETATEMRFIQAQQIDQMIMGIYSDATGGNLKAIDRALKLMDHKAKLFGLYAPAQVKVSDWRSEVLQLLDQGRITIEDVRRELGDDEANRIIESRSGEVVEGSYSEKEGPGDSK